MLVVPRPFDSNDSIIFSLLVWKWQIPQPSHETLFCNLSIGSTPQRALLSTVRSAPIGTGQDDQQLKFAYGFLNNKRFSGLTFLVAENVEKFLDTRGLGNLYYDR